MEDVLAAPSPATETVTPQTEASPSDQAVANKDFHRYREIENARQAGKPLPEAPASSTKPSAAAEKPAGTAPVPEPGSAQEKKGARKPDAEARIRELLAENKALKEAGTGVNKPAEAPPADKQKPAETKPATPEAPKRPKLEDFSTYDLYEEARDEYVEKMADHKAKLAVAADRETREKAEADKRAADEKATADQTLNERFESAKAAHADFAEVAFSAETPVTEVMDAIIRDSEHAGELLYKLGENGSAEGKRIAALGPVAQARELLKLEASITPAAPKKETPVKPKTTNAPKPPTDLGARHTVAADEAEEALAAKDFPRYKRVMNERDRKR